MTENETRDMRLCKEVEADFAQRQQDRRQLEKSWQLNMNFVAGRQYCAIGPSGEIIDEDKRYFWQTRRVFNHIAPVVDLRCAKLSRIRPSLAVRAASDDESDRHSASVASAILASAAESLDFDSVLNEGTVWAETCGTAFYKIVWNPDGGKAIANREDGGKVYEGDVGVRALSPFEIYPQSLSEEKLDEQQSVIHARAVPVRDIYEAYGVMLEGRDIDEFVLAPCATPDHAKGSAVKTVRRGAELVIERYEKPTEEFPDGRLIVVAGGKLLYEGALPYINGASDTRVYPFVKQISVPVAGSFFGASVVDRLIPVQRAFNAVKNRKHEFLSRIAMGSVAVEDGSVDCDELSEDGLAPGKIIVYRQGGKPPEMLSLGSVPAEFWKEEEALLDEFAKISGTGDLSQNADAFSGVTSATGLQLIIDQDEVRLNFAYQSVKRALKEIGKHALRLYRQFAGDGRLLRFAGANNSLSLVYFKGSDISSDDVIIDADTDLNLTPAQRRNIIYEMLDRGLFSDEDGKISSSAKNKILELLGYGGFAGGRDIGELNRARAGEENLTMLKGDAEVKDYDDHAAHISEHAAYLLTEKLSEEVEKRISEHISIHKSKLSEANDGQRTD